MSVIAGYTADVFGKAALEAGIAEARLRHTTLIVVNSTAGDSYVDAAFSQTGDLQGVQATLAAAGIDYEIQQPVGVYAADALLAAMDAPDAELLIIGIRHRNPVGKLLLGSVSQKLILECAKPVLAVKPPE